MSVTFNVNSMMYSNQVTLEKIVGLTVNSSAALATDPKTGTIAYPAG